MLGVVAGGIAIRRQGIYFAMITLALAQMMYFFALRAPFTGGEDGIQAVPRGRLFGLFDLSNQMTMYAFVLVVVLAAFLLIYRIINSPFGEVLKAIRENEQRPSRSATTPTATSSSPSCCRRRSPGSPARSKRWCSSLPRSPTCTGPCRAKCADDARRRARHGVRAGGRRLPVIAMQNYLAPFGQWVLVIQGVIFVVCVLVFRRGIIGELAHFLRVQL